MRWIIPVALFAAGLAQTGIAFNLWLTSLRSGKLVTRSAVYLRSEHARMFWFGLIFHALVAAALMAAGGGLIAHLLAN